MGILNYNNDTQPDPRPYDCQRQSHRRAEEIAVLKALDHPHILRHSVADGTGPRDGTPLRKVQTFEPGERSIEEEEGRYGSLLI